MMPGSVAGRYAKALYELAVEEGTTGEIGDALEVVAGAVEEHGGGKLVTGAWSVEARRAMGRALGEPFGLESTFGRFLQLVAMRDRLVELPGVRHWYVRLTDAAAGRLRAKIVTANQLGQSELGAIVAALGRLASKEIVPEQSTNPELLGGVVVELEGRVLDGSVKTRLDRLVARMAGNGS